jgi:tetratricopeptide (TPR) repeat protein/TolB-like protein
MNLKTFYEECKKRSVISNLSVYAVSAWVLIQVAATTFPYLGIPKSAVTLVIIFVLIGLPVTIIMSWYYNIVPDPEDKVEDVEIKSKGYFNQNRVFLAFVSILSVAVLATIIHLVSKNLLTGSQKLIDGNSKIAVAHFSNLTQDNELENIGHMVSNYISYGISQSKEASVVDYNTIEEYQKVSKASLGLQSSEKDLSAIFGPLEVVNGTYYKSGDQLIFQAYISDSKGVKFAHTFDEITCNISDPLVCIETLKQKVLGYWELREDPIQLQDPPLYDAYQYYLQARDKWLEDYTLAETFLKKALEVDPDYVDAKIMLVALYYNTRSFDKANAIIDSLRPRLNALDLKLKLTNYQTTDLRYHMALLDGDNKKVHQYLNELNDMKPNDIFSNISMMVVANEFVNKPELVAELYEQFNDENIDYEKCTFCITRLRNAAIALNSLNEPLDAIELIAPVIKYSKQRALRYTLIKSYARAGQKIKLREFVNNQQKEDLDQDPRILYIIAAQECLLAEQLDDCDYFVEEGLKAYNEGESVAMDEARLLIMDNQFKKAIEKLESILGDTPSDVQALKYMGISQFASGEESNALATINQIEGLSESNNRLGYISYSLAQVYARSGQTDKVFYYLDKAMEEGWKYTSYSLLNDPELKDYFDDPRFEKILSYWK